MKKYILAIIFILFIFASAVLRGLWKNSYWHKDKKHLKDSLKVMH
ncbi:MAG: hypothetical protein NVV82_27645 [Sporocytophaga sp.]|nr:hypothetical protein [Sporocytophaga sp.]